MDVLIEAAIIGVFVLVIIGLCSPIFVIVGAELGAAASMLGSTIATLTPYFDFGRGMIYQLVGSQSIANMTIIFAVLLPIMYFIIAVTAKVINMFVK